MSKRQNTLPTALNAKEEFLNALRPLKKVTWVNNLIKTVEKPQTNMPTGKNAHTERFILALSICLCLFEKNNASLLSHGKSLREYANKYATKVPVTQTPLITDKLNELMSKDSKKIFRSFRQS